MKATSPGVGEWVAEVGAESGPHRGRSKRGARRLKDISHLYLSGRAAPAARRQPPPQRRLRLGFATDVDAFAKAEVCANLAVQFARLGRRTLLLDLDPSLPNLGFLLGLEAHGYLAHLRQTWEPQVERAVLGLRLMQGLGAADLSAELTEKLHEEIARCDCVLVSLPPWAAGAREALERLDGVLRTAPSASTLTRGASSSPMMEAWLATAKRAPAARLQSRADHAPQGGRLDALVYVDVAPAAGRAEAALAGFAALLAPAPTRRLLWGALDAADASRAATAPQPWAQIAPSLGSHASRLPVSSLEPEHPSARTYENLAQSLLAGLASPGGAGA